MKKNAVAHFEMDIRSEAGMETDEQQIQRLMAEWHRRTAQGELDAILGLMTEDAVFLRCGLPPMTKAEFAAGFRDWAGKARIESTFDIKDIHASGDVAYVWCYISLVITATETGGSTTREGHVLSIFRKSASGTWLLARDANLIQAGQAGQAGQAEK
jgi:uncharacterized protein (TIGR02246 family)